MVEKGLFNCCDLPVRQCHSKCCDRTEDEELMLQTMGGTVVGNFYVERAYYGLATARLLPGCYLIQPHLTNTFRLI